MHLKLKMKYLGAILVHPVRRQNFYGKLHITTSETVSYDIWVSVNISMIFLKDISISATSSPAWTVSSSVWWLPSLTSRWSTSHHLTEYKQYKHVLVLRQTSISVNAKKYKYTYQLGMAMQMWQHAKHAHMWRCACLNQHVHVSPYKMGQKWVKNGYKLDVLIYMRQHAHVKIWRMAIPNTVWSIGTEIK